jgi:copper chaperone NosL
LNFGAYSIPDVGGWIFVAIGAVLLALVILELKTSKPKNVINYSSKKVVAHVAAMLLVATTIVSCNVKPQPFKLGKDNCYFCKMTVSDARFGAEIITQKGKMYKFDDTHCLLSFLKSGEVASKEIKDVYFVTFNGDHSFVKADEAILFKSDALNTPMNGNVAAFASSNELNKNMQTLKGTAVNWKVLSAE